MILLHSKLKKELKKQNIIFSNKKVLIGPNSIDVRLGKELITYTKCKITKIKINNKLYKKIVPIKKLSFIDVKKKNKTYKYKIPKKGLILSPNILYLGHTIEQAGSVKYVPMYEGRSSMARLGLQSHLSAGFGDIGFKQQWTLEIVVIHPLKIYKNMRIGQVYFLKGKGNNKHLYKGKYNKQKNIQKSKSYKDFN